MRRRRRAPIASATAAASAAPNGELRGEVRQDKANEEVYLDNGSFKKTLMTYGLQGIYKF